MTNAKQVNLTSLFELILAQFNLEELRTLAFRLDIEYDDLPGEGRPAKARELINYLDRRQRSEELIAECRLLRPNGRWNDVYEQPISPAPEPDSQPPHDAADAEPDSPTPEPDVQPSRTNIDAAPVSPTPAPDLRQSNRVWIVGSLAIVLIAALLLFLSRWPDRNVTPSPEGTDSAANLFVTPTPSILRPVPTALTLNNCSEEISAAILGEIEAAGGTIENDAALLGLTIDCNGEQLAVDVQMPAQPAYRLEFVDEFQELHVTANPVYGRSFIRAILSYSVGNYPQVIAELSQSEEFLNAPHAYLLHGHARLHLGHWEEARQRYEKALEAEVEASDQARLLAATGVSYILEYEEKFDTFATCAEKAEPLFTQATALDPERALWWAGRAWARTECPQGEVQIADIQADMQKAMELAPDQTTDQVHALLLEAFFLLIVTDDVDKLKAEDNIRQALEISPEIAWSYQLSSCLHFLNNDLESADSRYREFMEHLTFAWQITQSQPRRDNQDYCN